MALLLSWHRHPKRYGQREEIILTNDPEYSLTEFLIEENVPVELAFTKTTTEFIKWLEQGAKGE